MAEEIAIWPGSSSFAEGVTPFGFYDSETTFQTDADKVANWCATKMGYPIVDVELQDVHFYAAFEEAVNEFSHQVNQFNIRENMLNLQGAATGSNLQGKEITPTMARVVSLAENYGSEAGSGGNVTWRTGSISMTNGIQDYDLNAWAATNEPGEQIEIKKIFHEGTPAMTRYFDPFIGTGMGSHGLLNQFGWGNFSPATSFMMMPMYADILRVQAIEFNDMIRKSGFSFQLINNQLKIFPIPTQNFTLHFRYIRKSERANPVQDTGNGLGVVSDYSNVPFQRMQYTFINDVGKQWIWQYAASMVKKTLGEIRQKYNSIPIPGNEMNLNGDQLVQEARGELEKLVEEIRDNLDASSRRNQLEKQKDEAEFLQGQLMRVPLKIYVG